MEYSYNLRLPHIPFNNFKRKDAYILIDTIINGYLGEFLEFETFGTAETNYDNDELGRAIDMTETSEFTRNKINCIIFNIRNSVYNPYNYNKVIVHFSLGKKYDYYYFDFLNTETGHTFNKDTIDYDIDSLVQGLKISLHGLKWKPIHDKYYAKWKEFHGDTQPGIRQEQKQSVF